MRKFVKEELGKKGLTTQFKVRSAGLVNEITNKKGKEVRHLEKVHKSTKVY